MESLIEAIGPGATTAFVIVLVLGSTFVAWKLACMVSSLNSITESIREMKEEIKDVDNINRADHGKLWSAFEDVKSDVQYLRGRAESEHDQK